MTVDQRALLDDIIANPDDPLLRLILADWYEDNGQPDRAEFIRLEVEVESLKRTPEPARKGPGPVSGPPYDVLTMSPVYGPPYDVLTMSRLLARIRRLLETPQTLGDGRTMAARHAWAAEALPLHRRDRTGWNFRGGFIGQVVCSFADWMRHGPAIATAHPIERVDLTDKGAMRVEQNCYRWGRAGRHRAASHELAPVALWQMVTYDAQMKSTGRAFGSLEEASAALSAALIQVARDPSLLGKKKPRRTKGARR
jgi:uncharacterized protein (TIGR02996 family)